MQYLSGNAPIMHIAQKFRMETITRAGVADAYLDLQPDSPAATVVGPGEPVDFSRPGTYPSLH